MYALVLMMGMSTPAAPPAQFSPPVPAPAPTATVYVQQSTGCNGSAAAPQALAVRSAGCSGSAAFAVHSTSIVRHVTVQTVQEVQAESCSGGEALGLRSRLRERRHLFPLFRARGCGG